MTEQERFEVAYENTHKPIIARPYPKLENGSYQYLEMVQAWDLWQAATAQVEADEWISVDDRLPKPLRNVLVLIDDSPAKNANRMVANFIPKFTEEASCEEWSEYCEEKDLFYCPQGWYANTTYIGDEYASYFIDEKVTHWQPLPKPPKELTK